MPSEVRARRRLWHPWKGLAGLPADAWVLAGASLINRSGSMVLPFLVLYLTQHVGMTPSVAGMMLAVYGGSSLVAAPVFGSLSDRLGPVRVMRLTLIASGLLLLVYPLASGLLSIVGVTILLSMVTEGFRPANLAMYSDLVGPERRKPAFALARLAVNLGMSVGPALGGFLAERSYLYLFWVNGGTTLAAAAVLVLWPFGRRKHRVMAGTLGPTPMSGGVGALAAAEMNGEAPAPGASAWKDRNFLVFLLSVFPLTFVFFQHMGPMALYFVDHLHLSKQTYGLVFTVNTLMIVFLEVPLNTAMAAWPHGKALALGSVLTACGFGGLAFPGGLPLVIITTVIWTFGEMVLFPTMSAYVADASPPSRTGQYMGLYTMTFGLAFTIGPWFGTLLLVHYGGAALWGVSFLIALLAAALFRRL
jgi:MFS family permease